jgi:hypothetical protein
MSALTDDGARIAFAKKIRALLDSTGTIPDAEALFASFTDMETPPHSHVAEREPL